MNFKNELVSFLGSAFFTVCFQKKDGTWRTLNGRLGVKRHLRGGERTVGDEYIMAWDCHERGYRCFLPEKVAWVKCHGVMINFKSMKMGLRKAGLGANLKMRKAA